MRIVEKAERIELGVYRLRCKCKVFGKRFNYIQDSMRLFINRIDIKDVIKLL